MRRHQQGLATVEAAITGAVAVMVLFGCIEIGRMLFVWNTIVEATRRGAHIAAICPPGDSAITEAVLFGDPEASPILAGLRNTNVSVSYMDDAGGAPAEFEDIAYVSVAISGFQHVLIIPFLGQEIAVPSFTTTVPVESLGFIPETGIRVCLEG